MKDHLNESDPLVRISHHGERQGLISARGSDIIRAR